MSTDKPASALSYLDVVNLCDNYSLKPSGRDANGPHLVPFRASPDSVPIGLLLPPVLEALKAHNKFRKDQSLSEHWDLSTSSSGVTFVSGTSTPAARTRAMHDTTTWWRDAGYFAGVISPAKWRGEWYAIYADPFGPLSLHGGDPLKDEDDEAGHNPNYVFSMERAACALFGTVTYGVHMTVYENDTDGAVRIWVPRRAATKPTFPGMLDNSIAGGIPARTSPRWSLAKEAMEEGSIPEALVDKYTTAVGLISYFYRTSAGWLQPEVEFVYDMCVPSSEGLKLSPGDNEVETFKLMPLEEVIKHVLAGEFKPNCGVVIVDFLIRHGYLTPENEPRYTDILTRMHSRFDYDRWEDFSA